MALLGRLLLLVLMAAGPAIAASPMDDHTQQSPPGHRRLLATMPGRPSVTGIGTVGPTTVMYVDVTPPTRNGSSPITAYEVTGTPVGGLALGRPTLRTTGMGTPTTGVNSRRFTFVNYPRGVAYRFTVRALNRAGPSPASMTSTAFTTPKLGVPGPPMVTLTRLPAGVYLDVTPPTQGTASVLARPLTYTVVGHPDGGATAQRPRIVITGAGSLVPAGQAGAGSSSLGQQPGRRGGTPPTQSKRRFRITGHLPNTVYRFAVSAANSAGVGPESVQRIVFYECKNGFKDNGTGCKCPAILNCDGFMKDSCACSKCKPYHTRSANGSSCTCNIARTNCQTVAKDGCSCQACKAGWTSDGSGGCTKITGPSPQCAPLANCKTYSQVDCKCTQCNPGWGNCDNNSTNGCETRIDSPTACGSCNTNCTLANATPRCDSGTCQVASCARGWGNCDNNSTNGCETPLSSPQHCGSCNTTCALPQATATCATGTCQVASCDAGWGDCDHPFVLSWGQNSDYQLGDGTTTSRSTPASVSASIFFLQISAGFTHTCGLDRSGSAFCWGSNVAGRLGKSYILRSETPDTVSGDVKFRMISAGNAHTCGLEQSSGHAYCWGSQFVGGGTMFGIRSEPVIVDGGISFAQISAGGSHTCGIESGTGLAWCWGRNSNGQLGIAAIGDRNTPTSVFGDLTFAQISAGDAHTCGLESLTGKAFCWGSNEFGRLGNGTTGGSVNTPVSVAGGFSFSQISAGATHTCAIEKVSGRAFCWGWNVVAQLGNNAVGNSSSTPISVSGGTVFTHIDAGAWHNCGLTTTGEAFCWGENVHGELGDGTNANQYAPVRVFGDTVFKQISAGWWHTVALAGWGTGNEDPGNGCETPLNTPQHCGSCAPCKLPHATADCVNGVCAVASCDAGWGDYDNDDANGCETPLDTNSK